MPEVTALMAVYNGMPYLPLAIESILNQTFSDFEFLIVNDCSTDNTRDVILGYDDPRIRWLDNEENINQTRSLNRGLEHTRTELVARMDADDISHPRRLEMQVAFLRAHPEVAVLGTGLRIIDRNGRLRGKLVRPGHDLWLRWQLIFGCPLTHGSAMYRRSVVWDELGGYDDSFRFSQDYDLWSRVAERHSIANLRDLLLDYRVHPEATGSRSRSISREEDRRIIRANQRRILKITDAPGDTLNRVDLMFDVLWTDSTDHLDQFLRIIEEMHGRFCHMYPEARTDPDIRVWLADEYFRVANKVAVSDIRISLRTMLLAKQMLPTMSTTYFVGKVARWVAVCAGARRLKTWYQKKIGMTS